ncbi:hypothetical protein COCON_G00058310 [Conger conger]|uniref:Ig-like domain-containing protein n=1 Tax=Conger conger TaxID=82655 RepID=A0A9Q1I382_CONCO|nr:hypothetical protein COCON_G00058310 [Conger conger]
MRTYIVLILALTGAQCQVLSGPETVTGLVNHTVTITCRYKNYRYAVKSWDRCQSKQDSQCVRKASTSGLVADSRVSITDKKSKGVFNVTMRSLTEEDEGWYQCIVQGNLFGPEHSHSVYLTVSMGDGSEPDPVGPTPGGRQTSPVPTPGGQHFSSTTTGGQQTPPEVSDLRTKPTLDVAGLWAVMRWVIFSLMLACFLTVSWWTRSAGREAVPTAAHIQ